MMNNELEHPKKLNNLPLCAHDLMPTDAQSQSVLRQRANKFAQEIEHEKVEQPVQYLCCRLGQTELYGVPFDYLEEMISPHGATQIPGAPAFIYGVINHNSQLLTIIDLMAFFKANPAKLTDDSRIVIVKDAKLTVGIIVNSVESNDFYFPSMLAKSIPSEGVVKQEYVLGVNNGLVTILDIGSLLSDSQLIVDETG